ncbi:MAG: ankyrin repeat domain-containing protein [Firmicutes bacterium]|nr:ankyrin repeat domain-containing protein [Bacillota bacterium]
MAACLSFIEQLNMVKYLIEKGANINEKNNAGQTALMYAAEDGHLEIVKFLMEKGADLDAKDVNNETAFMKATQRGHTEIVRLLIDKV